MSTGDEHMLLSDAAVGHEYEVEAIIKGRRAQSRLSDHGILPGTRVKVIAIYPAGGPVLVQAGGSRVALGRRLASSVVINTATES